MSLDLTLKMVYDALKYTLFLILILTTLDPIYIADANTLCHEENGKLIDNKESCRQTVSEISNQEPKAKFIKEEFAVDWPKGCYITKNSKNIYFNIHSVGYRNPKARPLCTRNSGTQYQLLHNCTL